MNKEKFLTDLNSYIRKISSHQKNQVNCGNIFDNSNSYSSEKAYLDRIKASDFSTTKEQGDLLEELVKSLFSRIDLIHSVEITNRDITLGQIDIQLIPVVDTIYDVWGLLKEQPSGIIGECKNYSKKKQPVGRPEIEKTCWRSCKGGCLSFFIGYAFTEDAIKEVGYFNSEKKSLCCKHSGTYVILITVPMLEVIVENQINFCYFIKWAIAMSSLMNIAGYL